MVLLRGLSAPPVSGVLCAGGEAVGQNYRGLVFNQEATAGQLGDVCSSFSGEQDGQKKAWTNKKTLLSF